MKIKNKVFGIIFNKTISNNTKKEIIYTPNTPIADHACSWLDTRTSVKSGGVKQVLCGLMCRFIAISYVIILNCMLMALPLRDDNQ
jgi:hypothetical protein